MPKTLTTAVVERKRPPAEGRETYADKTVPGLQFRITDRGVRTFSVVYRVRGGDGKLRRMTIGRYSRGDLDLAEARRRARTARELADRGIDPAQQRDREAEENQRAKAEADANAFRAIAEEFYRRHRKRNNTPRTVAEGWAMLEVWVLPDWGSRPVGEITRRDVRALVDRMLDEAAPSATRKTLKDLHRLFAWAVDREIVAESPAAGIKVPAEAKDRPRERTLSDAELACVWLACERFGHPFGPLFRMLILTGQRLREVAEARWPEFDLSAGAWTLPSQRTKSRRQHTIPLAPAVVELLNDLPRFQGTDLLFPVSARTGGPRQVPPSGFSPVRKRLDRTIAELRRDGDLPAWIRRALGQAPLPAWVLHDIRRTAASGFARLGTPLPVLARVLNHSAGSVAGITAIYDRHGYEPEMRHALERWANYVLRLEEGPPSSDVVDFAERRAAR